MHSTVPSTTTTAEGAARLLELIQMRLVSEAVHVVARLGVADLLADGPKSIEQLAKATGADATSLGWVLRASARFGVFSQDAAGQFALGRLGESLKSDVPGSLHPAALFFGGETGASTRVRTGESATHKLDGSKPLFEWLQGDPERTKLFNSVMTSFSTLHLTGVLEAYDFSRFKKIVDVGGGHGKIISEILKRNPEMRGVLFELPHALEGGGRAIAEAGLAERCEVISGDLFVSVPSGADAYLLSRVIHALPVRAQHHLKQNQPTVRSNSCPHIFQNCDGLLLVPVVYPILSDLNMLLLTGGCERTEDEYRGLYQAAGFELTRAVATKSPTGTTVIEGRPI
jgi:O-methyltransferase domain